MPLSILRKFAKHILIGTNLTIALCFLAGNYVSNFNPAQFWFIGLLTLASFYLLLLLVGFLLFWIFASPRWTLISLAAIVFSWSPLKELVGLNGESKFSKIPAQGSIRVMSWNVEHFNILEHKTHPEKKAEMIRLINEFQPDITCFQEMVAGDQSEKSINNLTDFVQELNMLGYHYSYNPKLDFDNNHHFGIIIFSKKPFIRKETISNPPHDYNSIFQYADVNLGIDTIRIFNLHLQSLKFTESNKKYIDDPSFNNETDLKNSKRILGKFKRGFIRRQIQSEKIRSYIDSSPYPVIVCGDFNDVPNSYAYRKIGNGLNNAFTEKGSGIGRTFSGISPTLRIDNIFVSPQLLIDAFYNPKKKMSDHFPLFADISTKK